jgi:hypothetical protein
MVYPPYMGRTNTAAVPKRPRKMTRRQAASHANTVRWARERAKHFARLQAIQARAITSESALAALGSELPPDQAEAHAVALAQLLGQFRELWEFSGHALPVDLRDYAAGVIDELRRQAAQREGDQV